MIEIHNSEPPGQEDASVDNITLKYFLDKMVSFGWPFFKFIGHFN